MYFNMHERASQEGHSVVAPAIFCAVIHKLQVSVAYTLGISESLVSRTGLTFDEP